MCPDNPEAASAFRRLVAAFEILSDASKRGSYETQRKRSSARTRAQAAWEDLNRKASGGGSGYTSASERPAGSRREAEAKTPETREQSERRRQRWREIQFEEVFREHMPLEYGGGASERIAFAAALEVAVQSFVRKEGGKSAADEGAAASDASSTEEDGAELMTILRLSNLEVLRVELSDARHRSQRHRERARWLEGELALSEKKAAMWRGATPGSESERVQAMKRELACSFTFIPTGPT